MKYGHKTGQFQVGVGDMAKISYTFVFRHFTILSGFFVMLGLGLSKIEDAARNMSQST